LRGDGGGGGVDGERDEGCAEKKKREKTSPLRAGGEKENPTQNKTLIDHRL